jgi:hypothetical protein
MCAATAAATTVMATVAAAVLLLLPGGPFFRRPLAGRQAFHHARAPSHFSLARHCVYEEGGIKGLFRVRKLSEQTRREKIVSEWEKRELPCSTFPHLSFASRLMSGPKLIKRRLVCTSMVREIMNNKRIRTRLRRPEMRRGRRRREKALEAAAAASQKREWTETAVDYHCHQWRGRRRPRREQWGN